MTGVSGPEIRCDLLIPLYSAFYKHRECRCPSTPGQIGESHERRNYQHGQDTDIPGAA